MRALLLGAVLVCVPMLASALSCTPHSIEAAFLQAQADTAQFVVVHGKLDFDARALPKVDYDNQQATPDMTRIKGELSGYSLSAKGFLTPYRAPVTLAIACYGPWCAAAQKDADVLAFVELGAAENVIATNPCGGYLFTTPTPEMIRSVQGCFAQGTCTPLR